MKSLTRMFVCICSASLLFLGLTLAANAYPTLRILHPSLAGGMVEVADTDMDGIVQYSEAVGGFLIVASIGTSYPALGSVNQPYLDLFSVEITSQLGYADSVTVMLTDTGFIGSGNSPFVSGIGGTTDGTVDARSYLDNTNTAFGNGTMVSAFNSADYGLGFAAFGAASYTNLATAALYSMTLVTTVTHTGVNQASSFNYYVRLTEPGTIALLGMGLIGLGLVRRRLSKT